MTFHARFFGRFEIDYGGKPLAGIRSQKSLEVLAYLLLKREAHSREALASLIWGDTATTDQCRKYLRNTLWQLQKKLLAQIDTTEALLQVDSRSISIDPNFPVWTDIEEFESNYEAVRDHDGSDLTGDQIQALRRAVDLYTGPFLEGWFTEWCLVHRERSQHLVLLMLDKLMDNALVSGEIESGILYGERILSYDRAREVTHRNLMKLFYFAGDRTSAMRQYNLCKAILMDELEIEPSERTRGVLEAIKNDSLPGHDISTK